MFVVPFFTKKMPARMSVPPGATIRATLQMLRAQGPAHLVTTVPVGPREVHDVLRGDADVVICLEEQEPFEAVGLSYDDFRQVSDETVERILQAVWAGASA